MNITSSFLRFYPQAALIFFLLSATIQALGARESGAAGNPADLKKPVSGTAMVRTLSQSGQAQGKRLLKFKLDVDDVLIVDKYQDIRINYGKRLESREEKNRIVLKVVKQEADGVILEGHFHTYSRSPRKTGEYRLESNYFSRFKIFYDGRYSVPDKFVMPNLRDLPTFPDTPMADGHTWSRPALETMDLKSSKIKIPVKVFYKYTGQNPVIPAAGLAKDKKYDRIEYRYNFNRPIPAARRGALFKQISGYSADELWFDSDEGIPVFDSNRLVYTFYLPGGRTIDYHFKIHSWYKKIKRINTAQKSKIEEDVKKDLKDQKNITVRKNKEGVVIGMNAILFDFDSDTLTPAARNEIKRISDVLKKYSDREIRISGYTDSSGRPDYNRKLSRRRARSVLKTLRKLGIPGKNMSYKGFGEANPIAPNTTRAGRARNRRVEILIVTE